MDSEKTETKIVVRRLEEFPEEIRPDFRSFILATWLKGNYYGNSFFRQMPQDLYFKKYAEIIEKVIDLETTEVRIACDDDNPSWLVGYSILVGPRLYWVHVKRDFRERGIAKLLLAGALIDEVKGTSKIGRAISEKKGLVFNPL